MAAVIDRAVVVPSRNLHRDVAEKLMKILEQAFVEGSFRQALQLANVSCFSSEGQSVQSGRATPSCIAPQTSIELSFEANVQGRDG
jgi:hypothetical protein